MECRRWTPGSDIYRPENDCACGSCLREEQRVQLVDELGASLRRPIVDLLDRDAMPDDIVSIVRGESPKKSRAAMLTRIELTHQAGTWLDRHDRSDQLDQIDRLRRYTGFRIGSSRPGWLHDWRAGVWVEDRVLVGYVADVWNALATELGTAVPPMPCSASTSREHASRSIGGCSADPSNVVPFPSYRWR